MEREKSDANGIIIINTKTPFIINIVRVLCLNNAAVGIRKKNPTVSVRDRSRTLRALKDYNNWKIIPVRPGVLSDVADWAITAFKFDICRAI